MSRETVDEIVREKQHEEQCASQPNQPKREVNDRIASYWEVGEQEKGAQIFGGMEGHMLHDEIRETNRAIAPLQRVVGRFGRVIVINQRDLLEREKEAILSLPESGIHNAAGVLREVRVLHSSRSTGKPCTGRRDGQVQTNRHASVTT